MQRQLEPIWDAIDSEQFGYALQLIEKTQKRYRTSNLTLLSLQGLCLAKESRVTEAIEICERIRIESPGVKDTYQNIHDILKASPGKQVDRYLVDTMESGFRSIKTEFIGRLWFMESVRSGNLLAQRRAAVELQKGFVSRHYFYLVLMSMRLLYRQDIETKENTLLGMLMYRMISKAADNTSTEPDVESSTNELRIETLEEFYLYLDILQLLGKDTETITALSSSLGRKYSGSHDLLLLHLDLLSKTKEHEARFYLAKASLEAGVNDWLILKALIDSSKFIHNISADDDVKLLLADSTKNKKCRNTILARIYMQTGVGDGSDCIDALEQYFEAFHDKLTTFEDLSPYITQLDVQHKNEFLHFMKDCKSATSIGKIISFTTYMKCLILLNHENMQSATLVDLIPSLLEKYSIALCFGSELKSTDNQYGDDLMSLAARILQNENSDSTRSTLSAIVLLEYALTHSKHNYQLKLLLVSLYREIGAWGIAHSLYQTLHIKHIQHDTLSYILLGNSSYEYCSTMQISSLAESQHIYRSNRTETSDAICQAYEHRTYSKVPEFLDFQKRLTQSIWRFESQLNIWSMELLLDKFVHQDLVDLEGLADDIYDNKSRHVMLDIFQSAKEQDSDHRASQDEVQRLMGGYRKIHMYQAIIRNERLPDEPLVSASTTNCAYEFVRALYDIKFNPSKSAEQASTILNLVGQLTLPNLDARDLTSVTLHQYGQVIEILKVYSVLSSRIKVDLLKTIKNKLQEIRKQTQSSLEKLRADIVQGELSIRSLEGIDIDSAFIEKVLEKIKHARRESVTCLLSIVKGIKI